MIVGLFHVNALMIVGLFHVNALMIVGLSRLVDGEDAAKARTGTRRRPIH